MFIYQVSNTLVRFIWVFYIPTEGPNFVLRTFIAGFLEVLRRWQWNFRTSRLLQPLSTSPLIACAVRLENEHLGNIDQYRVTREVPLPYSYDDPSHDSDGDDDEDSRTHRSAGSRSWRVGRKAPESDGTVAETGIVEE